MVARNRITCLICDVDLEPEREDDLCYHCRRRRIVDKRDTRPRILPEKIPVIPAKVTA